MFLPPKGLLLALHSQFLRRERLISLLCVLVAVKAGLPVIAVAGEKYTLDEPVTQTRVYHVSNRLEVSGWLETAVGQGKAKALPLKVNADHDYLERRLSGTGREAAALRSLRHYRRCSVKIEVDKRVTSLRLRDGRRQIVVQGNREGNILYSPLGPLSHGDLELLQMPGDSLPILVLLPHNPVVVGETWEPESWAVQMLTGLDAVLKSKMSCELLSADDGVAHVNFRGSIEGAVVGAATEIEVSGSYLYDLKQRYIKRVELTQKEKRSVGAVSPGMNLEAKVVQERKPAENFGPLTDAVAKSIPLEPGESLMLLALETAWSVRLRHDRNWNMFHQTADTMVLRLLENGSLIAQCNASRIVPAAPGRHTPEAQFQDDIRKTLGGKLKSIVKAEQLKVKDARFLYRVTAVGESNGIPMQWIYYLCAGPSGRQVSFVFTVESKLTDRLGNRDLGIVSSLEFLSPNRKPTKAANRNKTGSGNQ